MHGVVNRAIECFVRDTYTDAVWDTVVVAALSPVRSFEPMLVYEAGVTARVISAAAARIGKPHHELLEDVGIYLVSHPRYESLRRLLRFAGVTFEDFLLSIDDIPGRAHLALPDLGLVPIAVRALEKDRFRICCGPGWPGFGHVLAGGIRAMADDYGALVTLSVLKEGARGRARLELPLHAAHHARGRAFDLAAPQGQPA